MSIILAETKMTIYIYFGFFELRAIIGEVCRHLNDRVLEFKWPVRGLKSAYSPEVSSMDASCSGTEILQSVGQKKRFKSTHQGQVGVGPFGYHTSGEIKQCTRQKKEPSKELM